MVDDGLRWYLILRGLSFLSTVFFTTLMMSYDVLWNQSLLATVTVTVTDSLVPQWQCVLRGLVSLDVALDKTLSWYPLRSIQLRGQSYHTH